MGLYLEPQGSKKEWIQQHGEPALPGEVPNKASGKLPVVFLDNGAFYGLAVIFDLVEAKRFLAGRPDGVWYLVKNEELQKLLGKATWNSL